MESAAMYLALKHAPPRGFFKRAFHGLTAARLLTRYPHAGIVIADQLLHSNLSRGLHIETFEPTGWDLFEVPNPGNVAKLFAQYEGTKYDWFSLLAFVLPWNVRDGARLYCYEWCWLAMTGENPARRITPEDLLVLTSKKTN